MALPGSIPPYQPDPAAPSPRTTYIFGFRDVTNFTDQMVLNQKNHAQHSAPMWWIDEGTDNRVTLSDLGLAQRPDLVDSHTIHFHGFRNAIPLFDGVPELSISVPIGRDFTYFYRPHDPGTYMWHCHFEDVEHIHMGMTGLVFIRPAQNNGIIGIIGPGKYVFNDAIFGSPLNNPNPTPTPQTAGVSQYDREFGMFLSEAWASMHWNDAHGQVTDWSDYAPDYWLMNGRVYPDTLAPNGAGYDPVTGDLLITPGYAKLQYQPITSLVTANSGDRVLLRFVNLGYTQAAMTLDGIPMRIVGKDATLLRGRDGTNLTYETDTVYIGAGESYDAIFVAPDVTTQTTFLLYNRKVAQLANASGPGAGGQLTEIHIYPAGTLPPQTIPQT